MTDFNQTLTNDLAAAMVDGMTADEAREAAIRHTVWSVENGYTVKQQLAMYKLTEGHDHPGAAAWEAECAKAKADYKRMKDVADECGYRFKAEGIEQHVCFSMDALPLDDVYLTGTVVLSHQGWGEESNYNQRLTDPTLWDIVKFANKAICIVDDHHHTFLEGVIKMDEQVDGATVYRLSMGS